jgi:hypothetical protein
MTVRQDGENATVRAGEFELRRSGAGITLRHLPCGQSVTRTAGPVIGLRSLIELALSHRCGS